MPTEAFTDGVVAIACLLLIAYIGNIHGRLTEIRDKARKALGDDIP